MSVCFFNENYDTKYQCRYVDLEDRLEVEVEYDIKDEIEAVNGVKVFGTNTEYKNRDILIIDHADGKSILMKNAYFAGCTSVVGTPDGKECCRFQTNVYFESRGYSELWNLPKTPMVSRIKIYSSAITDIIGYPSLTIEKDSEEVAYRLKKGSNSEETMVQRDNITSFGTSDDWKAVVNGKTGGINIEFNGCLTLRLMEEVSYDLVGSYINEVIIFMQLYYPDKFLVDRVSVMIGDTYYKMTMPLMELEYKEKHVEQSVDGPLKDFLKKCYEVIPYRNSSAEIRNIPYIILNTSRSLEDNFLMFYRFIECFYKNKGIKNFVSESIKEHYRKVSDLSDDQIERYAREIICLRNQYVHSGYFIKDKCIEVRYPNIGKTKNPKNYVAEHVDIHWIYKRTKLLYDIVIDIIFKELLGFEKYIYKRHF